MTFARLFLLAIAISVATGAMLGLHIQIGEP